MVDREALAWAAGFFDGEGHAGTVFIQDRPRFGMSITQYEITTLERFHAAIGNLGNLYTSGVPAPSGKHRSSWSSYGFEQAQAVAALLWPWLSIPKRQQISDSLVLFHSRWKGQKKSRLFADRDREIKQLVDAGDLTYREIGEQFGITLQRVWLIAQRERQAV